MIELLSLSLFNAILIISLQKAATFMIWPKMNDTTRRKFVSQVANIAKTTSTSASMQGASNHKKKSSVQIGFVGDVMIGRGIDAILPYSVDSTLHESYMKDANGYVRLAIQQNGPLPIPSSPDDRETSYIWGDLVEDLKHPDALIVNLETALTTSNDWMRRKGIHYKSHPRNVKSLVDIGVDVTTLANNHVLDWGDKGLEETLQTLRDAGIQYAGAGTNVKESTAVKSIDIPLLPDSSDKRANGTTTVAIVAIGFSSAGVPSSWEATSTKCGVNFARDTNEQATMHILDSLHKYENNLKDSRPGIIIASLHWGPNWGWGVPHEWRQFAHGLIDHAGVDIVIGHSSHHVKGIEVYKGKMIAYGLGDFLNDYEGIRNQGYEEFRHDLSCLYRLRIDVETKDLLDVEIIPCKIHNLRVQRATSNDDISWLQMTLNKEGSSLGTWCETFKTPGDDTNLKLFWKD